MYQISTKNSYYINIGICALFGLGYFIVGLVNLIWNNLDFGIGFFSVGAAILIFSTIAFIGKRFGVILLIIIHIGNPITMVAAIQALRYLNEYGDGEVDIIYRKTQKRRANKIYQKEMKEKYNNEPKLD